MVATYKSAICSALALSIFTASCSTGPLIKDRPYPPSLVSDLSQLIDTGTGLFADPESGDGEPGNLLATYEVSLLIEQDFIKIINNKTVSSLRRIYDDPKITLQQKMMAAVSLRAAHSLTERDQGEILAAIRKKKWENMNFKDAQDWSEVSSLAYYLSGMKIPASLAKKLAKTDEEKRALIAILSNPVPLHNFQEIVDLNQDSLESIKSSLDLTDMPTIDLARATIALHLSGSIDNLELAHHRSLVEKRTGCHYSKNILFSTAQNRDACSLTASRIWMYSGVSSS